MRRQHRAITEISQIISHHDALRCFFPHPGPTASFVNENTVVRAAAVVERHIERRARRLKRVAPGKPLRLSEAATEVLGPWGKNADWPDVCIRALLVLRHMIVHLDGKYRPGRLRPQSRMQLLPAFRRFCRCVPAARVRVGWPLSLSGAEVIRPMLEGCRDHWKQRKKKAVGVR